MSSSSSSWRCPGSSLMEQISFLWYSNVDLVPISLEFLALRVEKQQQQQQQEEKPETGNQRVVLEAVERQRRKKQSKKKATAKAATNTSSGSCCCSLGDCPLCLLGNIMYFSVILARMQGPPGSSAATSSSNSTSFITTIFCCLLSLAIWTVAVVGTHHVRSTNHDAMSKAAASAASATGAAAAPAEGKSRPKFWFPTKEDPTLPLPPPPQQHLPTLVEEHSSSSVSWPPILQSSYRLDLSTEDNYQAVGTKLGDKPSTCQGKFADIRRDYLDYDFHKIYSCERQHFQDSLIESMLRVSGGGGGTTTTTTSVEEEVACPSTTTSSNPKRNWIVFTAGVMGAGKSFTMKQLHDKGRFPLDSFVTVDPDSVRRHLPEFDLYVQQAPEKAGYRTRKESGMISEILTEAALQRGQNVLVDGTLRNSTWYESYFRDLRKRYPRLQIGILHVTSPREAVLERAMSRAKVTGRVVPRDLLERTMVEVPKSIQILSKRVDYFCELHNPSDSTHVEIATKGVTWDSFERTWKQQSCSDNSIKNNRNNNNKSNEPTNMVVEVDTNTHNHNENSSSQGDYFSSIFRRRLERQRPQFITAVVG